MAFRYRDVPLAFCELVNEPTVHDGTLGAARPRFAPISSRRTRRSRLLEHDGSYGLLITDNLAKKGASEMVLVFHADWAQRGGQPPLHWSRESLPEQIPRPCYSQRGNGSDPFTFDGQDGKLLPG